MEFSDGEIKRFKIYDDIFLVLELGQIIVGIIVSRFGHR